MSSSEERCVMSDPDEVEHLREDVDRLLEKVKRLRRQPKSTTMGPSRATGGVAFTTGKVSTTQDRVVYISNDRKVRKLSGQSETAQDSSVIDWIKEGHYTQISCTSYIGTTRS